MNEQQYVESLRRNPHGIRNIPNPTEAMMLAAVAQNGMLLAHIKHPTPAVINAALRVSPRAIQYVPNPPEELALALVEQDWTVLEFIAQPSDATVEAALAQSGWAIKYVENPTEDVQLQAVTRNYDALQYIAHPTERVQLVAVQQNYQALRYIQTPTLEMASCAVQQEPQAMRLLTRLTKEMVLVLLSVTSYVIGYIPHSIGVTTLDVQQVIVDKIKEATPDEVYIRGLLHNMAIGSRHSAYPIDIVALVHEHGSPQAKRIVMDELLH